MKIWGKSKFIWIGALALLLGAGAVPAQTKEPGNSPAAAFVRGGDLWIKTGGGEKPLTQGETVRNPEWSGNGTWIAFSKVKGEGQEELWVRNIQSGQSVLAAEVGGDNLQWAPEGNRLAYIREQGLYLFEPEAATKPRLMAKNISNYSWLPDGSGFLVSTWAQLKPDGGWTQVKLLKVPLSAQGDPNRFETLFTLPAQSDDFFAVGTSVFKWSSSGKWIAFFAAPTASLSADSNTLCVLSSDGSIFKTIDRIVHNEQWFEWADHKDTLAYIAGEGREATSNKQLKVTEIPAAEPVAYTPKEYVDQAFTWRDAGKIVTSRAKQSESADDPAKPPFPFLAEVKLRSGKQRQMTSPPKGYGDFHPVSLQRGRLAWVRSDRVKGQVWLTGPGGKNPEVWIENIDPGTHYYEQWNWGTVLSFYDRP